MSWFNELFTSDVVIGRLALNAINRGRRRKRQFGSPGRLSRVLDPGVSPLSLAASVGSFSQSFVGGSPEFFEFLFGVATAFNPIQDRSLDYIEKQLSKPPGES